jgi:hypothetical protein
MTRHGSDILYVPEIAGQKGKAPRMWARKDLQDAKCQSYPRPSSPPRSKLSPLLHPLEVRNVLQVVIGLSGKPLSLDPTELFFVTLNDAVPSGSFKTQRCYPLQIHKFHMLECSCGIRQSINQADVLINKTFFMNKIRASFTPSWIIGLYISILQKHIFILTPVTFQRSSSMTMLHASATAWILCPHWSAGRSSRQIELN